METKSVLGRSKWKILRDCWMTAQSRENGLEIKCQSEAEAGRIRAELYRAARRAKSPRFLDQEFIKASDEISVTCKGSTIFLYQRKNPPMFTTLIDNLEQDTFQASLNRLEALLRGEAQPVVTFNETLFPAGEDFK